MGDNYFDPSTAADRYIRGRPYFHPRIIAQIKTTLALQWPLHLGLDIACGTGMSAHALKDLVEQVIGIDSSAEMLKLAEIEPGMTYLHNVAESLSFAADRSVDIITVSQAFHWINQQQFLKEAQRVLRPNGYLVIYDFHFADFKSEHSSFLSWFRDDFLVHFPRPPRNQIDLKNLHLRSLQLILKHSETLEVRLAFSKQQLLHYLLSLSYVTAKVEYGQESIADAESWLDEHLTALFEYQPEITLDFHAPIWYIQKNP